MLEKCPLGGESQLRTNITAYSIVLFWNYRPGGKAANAKTLINFPIEPSINFDWIAYPKLEAIS